MTSKFIDSNTQQKKSQSEYVLKIDGLTHSSMREFNLALALDKFRKVMTQVKFKRFEVFTNGILSYRCDIRMPTTGFKFVVGSGTIQ